MLRQTASQPLKLYLGPRNFRVGIFTYLAQAGVDALFNIVQMGGLCRLPHNVSGGQIARVTRNTLTFSVKPTTGAIGSIFDFKLLLCEVAERNGAGILLLSQPPELVWWDYVPFMNMTRPPGLDGCVGLLDDIRFMRSDTEIAITLGITPDQVASSIVSRVGLP